MRNRWKQSYTLVEILVVLAIIGVLMSISMPAFEKITKGNRVGNAASMIGTGLSLARAQAVSNRKYVAMIFPLNTVTGSGFEAILKDYQFKAYRLCSLTYDGTNYTFDSWLSGSKWEQLRTGTVISEINDVGDAGAISSSSYSRLDKPVKNVKINSATGDMSAAAIIFTPYGSMVNEELYIKVTEGIFTSANASDKLLTSKDSSNKPLNYMAIKVNKFTGRASYQ